MEVSRREVNRELCRRFPFLIPHNRWTDNIIEDWDFEYTELDSMPDGWRIAFGEQMCEELEQELEKIGKQDKWRIMQLKEKYGFLHLYANWYTENINKIISKYEDISKKICINCGEPATQISMGWISPYCDKCTYDEERYMPIEKYYNGG